MEHIDFSVNLGFLTARAKFAAENPVLERKLGLWDKLPQELKNKLIKSDQVDTGSNNA